MISRCKEEYKNHLALKLSDPMTNAKTDPTSALVIKKVTNKLSIITGQYHCYHSAEKYLKEQSSIL